MPVVRRAVRLIGWLLLCALLRPVGLGLAQPAALTFDGERDAAYVLLATDPAADLAAAFAANPLHSWAEVSALYVTTDTTYLYVYVALPYLFQPNSTGQIGLAIDTTGDVPASGGANDPGYNHLTFAYTATHANTGTLPIAAANVILPEVVIRGNLPGGYSNDDNGYTELHTWNGSGWTPTGGNWGGVSNVILIGTHIAYKAGHGVEFFIPYADLGVPPETPLHLQFFTTLHQLLQNTGALDTVPADAQVTAAGQSTTLRRLASLLPPCASAAIGNSAAVPAGLAHDSPNALYRDPPGPVAPGGSATFRLRACPGDLQGVDLLVWDTADPTSAAPTLTYPFTATLSGGYAWWAGTATAPMPAADQWYQFRLTDGGPAGYVRPASGDSGPSGWGAALAAPVWRWPTLPGGALYLPLVNRP